jgi:signal transduction histidine kinase
VAEEKCFTLRLYCAPGATIRGDRHLLSQAVANLLDNALKYAGSGDIAIGVRGNGERAVIEVADHGPGIPEADRGAVFDRFVRLERSRSTPGNGLGLSLVRAVARRHGASVTLGDNQPSGQRTGPAGLTVRIEFPAWPQIG